MRLGRLLQLWRRREALTLRAAASRIGIHASTLARIERGEAMHGDTLTTLLVWLMGREEPSANEAFAFETKDTTAGEDKVAERNTSLRSGEAAGQVDAEAVRPPGAEIEDEQETAAEHPLHGLDQDAAMCGMREERSGGGTYGEAGVEPEGAG